MSARALLFNAFHLLQLPTGRRRHACRKVADAAGELGDLALRDLALSLDAADAAVRDAELAWGRQREGSPPRPTPSCAPSTRPSTAPCATSSTAPSSPPAHPTRGSPPPARP